MWDVTDLEGSDTLLYELYLLPYLLCVDVDVDVVVVVVVAVAVHLKALYRYA